MASSSVLVWVLHLFDEILFFLTKQSRHYTFLTSLDHLTVDESWISFFSQQLQHSTVRLVDRVSRAIWHGTFRLSRKWMCLDSGAGNLKFRPSDLVEFQLTQVSQKCRNSNSSSLLAVMMFKMAVFTAVV